MLSISEGASFSRITEADLTLTSNLWSSVITSNPVIQNMDSVTAGSFS